MRFCHFKPFFSRLNISFHLSTFPHRRNVPVPFWSYWPFDGLSPVWPSLSHGGESRTVLQNTIKGLENLPSWLECLLRKNLKFRITTIGFFPVISVRSLSVLFSCATIKVTGTGTVVYAVCKYQSAFILQIHIQC